METLTAVASSTVSHLKALPLGRAAAYAAAAAAGYLAMEQISLYAKGKGLPGPGVVVPLVGGIVEMVLDPYAFWERQRLLSPSGLSWNSIAGYFMIYSAKAETTAAILRSNGPDSFKLVLHPNGVKVFGDHNIAFKWGEELRLLRRSFLTLFTRKALGVYLNLQDKLIRESLAEWLKDGATECELRTKIRDMNVWTSQKVFCGPYIRNTQERDNFSYHYQRLVDGFLSFPLYFPGTGLWKAVKSRHVIIASLERYCRESKERMRAGGEPECLLDFWTQEILQEMNEASKNNLPPPKHSSDFEMGNTLMDFLFASQDASTASLTWIVALMHKHPEILAKVHPPAVWLPIYAMYSFVCTSERE
jgi:sterol 22-desaturase